MNACSSMTLQSWLPLAAVLHSDDHLTVIKTTPGQGIQPNRI